MRQVTRSHEGDVALPEFDAGALGYLLQFVGRNRLAAFEQIDAAIARNIKQHPACPDRRDGGRVSGGRAKIPEMCARRAAEPVVIRADGHMGEGVDMGAPVRSRQNILAHVAEAGVVAGPPGLAPETRMPWGDR